MFCTIKFVYYKSFCVRDDIGSYIRTVYHMVSHTPKRNAPGSSPGEDATNNAESLDLSRFSAFLFPAILISLANKLAEVFFKQHSPFGEMPANEN